MTDNVPLLRARQEIQRVLDGDQCPPARVLLAIDLVLWISTEQVVRTGFHRTGSLRYTEEERDDAVFDILSSGHVTIERLMEAIVAIDSYAGPKVDESDMLAQRLWQYLHTVPEVSSSDVGDESGAFMVTTVFDAVKARVHLAATNRGWRPHFGTLMLTVPCGVAVVGNPQRTMQRVPLYMHLQRNGLSTVATVTFAASNLEGFGGPDQAARRVATTVTAHLQAIHGLLARDSIAAGYGIG